MPRSVRQRRVCPPSTGTACKVPRQSGMQTLKGPLQGCRMSLARQPSLPCFCARQECIDLPWGQTDSKASLPAAHAAAQHQHTSRVRGIPGSTHSRRARILCSTSSPTFLGPATACSGFRKSMFEQEIWGRVLKLCQLHRGCAVQLVLHILAGDLHAPASRPVARTVSVSDLDLRTCQPASRPRSQPHVSLSPRLSAHLAVRLAVR
ncbi:hypothetical protein IWX50DRAFT_21514 [Phyllosticta citricarpa]